MLNAEHGSFRAKSRESEQVLNAVAGPDKLEHARPAGL